jgi:hypothetical protein
MRQIAGGLRDPELPSAFAFTVTFTIPILIR